MSELREALPDGWALVERGTRYELHSANAIVATLTGPDAESNAAKIAAAINAVSGGKT